MNAQQSIKCFYMTNKHDHFNALFIRLPANNMLWRTAPKNDQSGQNLKC